MSVEIEARPVDALIIITFLPPVTLPDDQTVLLERVVRFKQETGQHVYRIIDLRSIVLNFDNLLAGMENERGVPGGANDPDVTTYFVGTSPMVKFGVKILQEYSHIYGKTDVFFSSSIEEVLAHIKSNPRK